MQAVTPPTKESGAVVLMTTHKVVIDANDEDHAKWLAKVLTNDGFRVRREIRRWVSDNAGNVRQETDALRMRQRRR